MNWEIIKPTYAAWKGKELVIIHEIRSDGRQARGFAYGRPRLFLIKDLVWADNKEAQ